MILTASARIRRSPDDVFAYLADRTNLPEWMAGVSSSRKVTKGPVGPGTKFRVESKVFGLAIPSAYEVIRCDPPSVLTGRNTGLLTFSETYLLAPAPDGTEVSHTVEVDLAGRFMLLAPLVSLALRSQLTRDFAALKRVLEGAPGPAQASQAHSE